MNDYCEFPQELNMQEFTQGYLKKKEDQKNDQGNNNEEVQGGEADEYPPEYYQYTLRGTVIHMGTAESGHYYSFIKDNNSDWFEFNDSYVKPFDLKDLSREAFGGEEKLNIDIGNSKEVKERNRNAYLLFYERVAYFDENCNKVPTMLVGDHDRDKRSKIENMNPQILQETKEDNFKFHTNKYIWDKVYGEYVFSLLEQLPHKKEDYEISNPEALEVAKFCTLFFMTVVLRGCERIKIPPFLKLLKGVFRVSTQLCEWFLEGFVHKNIIREFLVNCPIKDMKYFVFGLIKIALNNCFAQFTEENEAEFNESTMCQFINSVIYVIHEDSSQVKLLDKLFDILAIFSGLGLLSKNYLNKKSVLGRLIYYMVPEKPAAELYTDYTEEFAVKPRSEVSELGQPSINSGVNANDLVKSASEMISKKKEKMIMEATSVNHSSLVETVINIASAAQPLNTDENAYELNKDEKTLLISNVNVVRLLLLQSTSKRARKLVSTFVTSLSLKTEDSGKEILLTIEKELRERDDVQLKVYLQTLEKMMLVPDEQMRRSRVRN